MDRYNVIDDMADGVGIVMDDPFDDAAMHRRLKRSEQHLKEAMGDVPGSLWGSMFALAMAAMIVNPTWPTSAVPDPLQTCCCENRRE